MPAAERAGSCSSAAARPRSPAASPRGEAAPSDALRPRGFPAGSAVPPRRACGRCCGGFSPRCARRRPEPCSPGGPCPWRCGRRRQPRSRQGSEAMPGARPRSTVSGGGAAAGDSGQGRRDPAPASPWAAGGRWGVRGALGRRENFST